MKNIVSNAVRITVLSPSVSGEHLMLSCSTGLSVPSAIQS